MAFVQVDPDPDHVPGSLTTDNPRIERQLRAHRRRRLIHRICAVGFATVVAVAVLLVFDPPLWVIVAISVVLSIAGETWGWRRRERRMRAVLIENRICVDCGYDCAAIEGDRCPECGEGLHSTVDVPCHS